MLQLPGGQGSQQVMLQVRFAEVNRAAMKELGLTLFADAQRFTGRTHDAAVLGAQTSTTTATSG